MIYLCCKANSVLQWGSKRLLPWVTDVITNILFISSQNIRVQTKQNYCISPMSRIFSLSATVIFMPRTNFTVEIHIADTNYSFLCVIILHNFLI